MSDKMSREKMQKKDGEELTSEFSNSGLCDNQRMFYFVDESGDPNYLGKGKKNLISTGLASRWFMVGYIELSDNNALHKLFSGIRKEISEDEFLNVIPSVRHSLKCFHANRDCREVQERVFKALKQIDFRFRAVVIEKKIDQFISKFQGKKSNLYSYLVERLLEKTLHLFPCIDIYFAKLDSVINDENMRNALNSAKLRMLKKYPKTEHGELRIFLQQPDQIAGLQAVDYCLWAIHRVYTFQDFRYYNFLNDKISLIHDLSFGKDYYGTYFNKSNPVTKERFNAQK